MKFEYLGPYRVEKILGQGGMGTVYLGTHANSGDSVAIKVIASTLADQERFRRRFADEVETLKRLKHDNIVQLIGYGEEQGHLFYSMEYVLGHSLAELLKKIGRVPWDRALEIAIEVCSALKHAHDLGIIHRDLKPANVMLTNAGRVKLTDFGIAKLFGSSEITAAGSVLGTADFMPPEQAEGKPVTVRSDLYALGALLFTMISGRSPHSAKSIPEVLYNVRFAVPLGLHVIVPETPPELSELVSQLLAKDMAQRPPTALVVGNRLQSLKFGLSHRPASDRESLAREVGELNSIDLDLGDSRIDRPMLPSKVEEQTRIIATNQPASESPHEHELRLDGLADAQTQFASKVDGRTNESSVVPALPGKTRFTVVDEQDRQRAAFSREPSEDATQVSHWLSVGALLVMIVASLGAILYFTRSPSADRLYERISAAVESGSDDDLADIEPIIEQFERLYPDDERLRKLATVKNEIEQQQTVRLLMRRSRVVGSEAEMDPVEQAFLDCMRFLQQDTELAQRKLRAFLTLFEHRERLTVRQQKLVEIAERVSEKLDDGRELKVNPATALLNEQIVWADSNLDAEQRRRFYRAILELYADKPWAASTVARIRATIDQEAR